MLRASRSPQRSTIALDILLGNHPGAIALTLILWRRHRTDVVGAGHIAAEAKRADSQRRELRSRHDAAFGVARAEHHVRAHLRERCCHLPSEPAASTGDDGDPPAEVE